MSLETSPKSKKYRVILADPPWSYNDKSKSHGGGAESHYPCMSTKDICNLKIPSADNAILFLWTTFPQLEEALKVIKAWGFVYKTCAFTWVKTNKDGTIYMGMGRYTRANAEICLLAKKGKGCKRINASIKNTQIYPRTKHSRKPNDFRDQIVLLFGLLPRIELFARKPKELFEDESFRGWDCMGNDISGKDIKQELEEMINEQKD